MTLFAVQYGLRPTEAGGQSIVAMAAGGIRRGIGFYMTFQAFTALILILAANTSYNAFPRLAAILAQDKLHAPPVRLPRRSAGLLVGHRDPGGMAFGLLWAFHGDTNSLIPLYSVGVFVSFTISQIGMVRHWRASASPAGAGARRSTRSAA